jgi:hypothetical protein
VETKQSIPRIGKFSGAEKDKSPNENFTYAMNMANQGRMPLS